MRRHHARLSPRLLFDPIDRRPLFEQQGHFRIEWELSVRGGRIGRRELIRGVGATLFFALVAKPKQARTQSNTWTRLARTSAGSNAGGPVNASPINVTGANLIIVSIAANALGSLTVSDSVGNTWSPRQNGISGANTGCWIFDIINPTVSSDLVVTVNSQHGCGFEVVAWRVSGAGPVYDPAGSAHSSNLTVGPITPSGDNALIVTAATGNNLNATSPQVTPPFEVDRAYNANFNGYNSALGHYVQPVAASVNPGWSAIGGNGGSVVVSYGYAVIPPTQNVTINVAYNGDLTTPAAFGRVASLSWSSGTATLTTTLPLPTEYAVGRTVQLAINNFNGNASGYFTNGRAAILAQVTGSNTMTYAVASNPGSLPWGTNYWLIYAINSIVGGVHADLTYHATGTCAASAADRSQIVVGRGKPSIVGHAVQRNSDPLTFVVGYDPVAGIARVASVGGLAPSFAAAPQAGDLFTVFPMNVTIQIGKSAAGSTFWQLGVYNPRNAAIPVSAKVQPGQQDLMIQGFQMHNPNVPLGKPANNDSAPVLKNGDGSSISNGTGLFAVGCAAKWRDLQLWETGGHGEVGVFTWCLDTVHSLGSPDIQRCTIYDELFDVTPDTPTMFMALHSFPDGVPKLWNCVIVVTFMADKHITNAIMDVRHCDVVCVGNFVGTLATGTNSGSNVLVLRAGQGANVIASPNEPGAVDAGGQLRDATNGFLARVASVSKDTVTLSFATARADIPAGTAINFGSADLTTLNGGGFSVRNSAIAGFYQPIGNHAGYSLTSSGNVTDANPWNVPGFRLASYAAMFNSASQRGSEEIDLRRPANSPLRGAATIDSAVPTDIFGNARPVDGQVDAGAVQYVTVSGRPLGDGHREIK
jgi:hypothetical protein